MQTPSDGSGATRPAGRLALDRVGPYRLGEVLGRGGMGVVYEAFGPEPLGRVAIKVLTALRGDDPTMQRRFQREAAIASRLDHPGICAVLDAGIADGVPYIAMPILKGHPLDSWLRQISGTQASEHVPLDTEVATRRLSPESLTTPLGPNNLKEVVRMMAAALRALHFAHESGVVHRDLKPANLFLCDDGQVKILDFGLARDGEEVAPTLTMSGDVFGTPAYMSPEQILGHRNVDRSTDIWSMGVTLFELLTFSRPFTGTTTAALFEAIRTRAMPDPRRLNPAIDRGLAAILSVSLAKDPRRRYRSADAFADDLDRWDCGITVQARSPGRWYRLQQWAKGHPSAAALLVAMLLGLPLIASLGTHFVLTRDSVLAGEALLRKERVDRILARGLLDFGDGSPTRLLAAAEEAEAVEPRDGIARLLRVVALRRLKRFDEALRNVGPDSPLPAMTAAHLRSYIVAQMGDKEEGRKIFEAAPPAHTAEDYYMLAATALERGSSKEVRESVGLFQEAMVRSDRPRVLFAIGRMEAAAALGDAAEVERAVETIRLRFSPDLGTEFAIGMAYSELKEHRKATDAFERARKHAPQDPHLLARLGLAYMTEGRLAEAEQLVEEALGKEPDSAILHSARGRIALNRSNPEQALRWLDQAAAINPELPYLQEFRFHALRQLNRVDEAYAALLRAVDLDPDNGKFLRARAAILAMTGRWDEAKEAFTTLVVSHPELASGHEGLARCLYHFDDYAGAKEAMARAVALAPEDHEYRHALCVMYCEDDEGLMALPHLRVLQEAGAAAADQGHLFVTALIQCGEIDAARHWLRTMRQEGAPSEQIQQLEALERRREDALRASEELLASSKTGSETLSRLREFASFFRGMPSAAGLRRRLLVRIAVLSGDPRDQEAAVGQ